ncbi:MAG: hypothetical protein HPY45_01535 [Anaerolineae bacterium]|nr:hypothetical protein [Anaerolineae bacterium]
MEKISSNLLTDTLNLVQLARETARIKGSQSQAERLGPVVQQLQTLVNSERASRPQPSQGVLAQADFQTMLSAAERGKKSENTAGGFEDRSRMVSAMAMGGMNDVEIARQLGMTRDEVRMILNLAAIGKRR